MQKGWMRAVTTFITIGIMIMIFCFSMEPAEKSDATSGKIAEKVADTVRPEWRTYSLKQRLKYFAGVQHVVRKCAHFTEFALLGASLSLCLTSWFGRRKWRWPASWAGATLYAALDESHQLLVAGRSGQWTDVLIDSSGALTGILICGFILWMIHRRKRKTI
ncbi:MAG: VanZ family protein [Clostridia bacterium]|nr:VanZ family protein [Clostridia bacterium]